MVERLPSKQDVAGSNPVPRSTSTHCGHSHYRQEILGELHRPDAESVDLDALERLLK